ncbi:MAG: hypothetical protein JWO81_2722, partial [Alphaproteobacteria bacterium]|nr:hypothetical protein [Alphaproteobacteria bacterium]
MPARDRVDKRGAAARAASLTGPPRIRQAAPMVRTAESDQARLAAVQRAIGAGDLAAAAELAEVALRDGLTHPMLLGVLAQRRGQEGRFEDALALLRRLKAAMPGNAAVVSAIGVSLIRLDRLDEAVAEFSEALAIDPRSADALANRAMALTALSRIGDARRDFEAAAAIDPDHLIAADGLAGLALRRGETAEARRLAARVLARRPG